MPRRAERPPTDRRGPHARTGRLDVATAALRAREIAEWMARHLPEQLPMGPDSEALVRKVADLCPVLGSAAQCNALVYGFRGDWPEKSGSSPDVRVARSAGRHLAVLKAGLGGL